MQPNFPIKHFYMSYCFQNNQPSFHPNCNNNNLSKELLNPINVLCFFARVQILLILRKIYYFYLIFIFYITIRIVCSKIFNKSMRIWIFDKRMSIAIIIWISISSFSVHKQKTKKSLRDLYKMGIVYLWRIYACIYNYLLENVLEKHPCYNCGDPIIFPTTGMLINMQFVEKRKRTYFEMLRTL